MKRIDAGNKVIHLFPKSKFTEEFINLINSHLNPRNHLFILYTNVPFGLPEYISKLDNVVDYDERNLLWLYGLLKKADRIVIHNLGLNVEVLAIFALSRRLKKKSIWLVWGGDLYCYRDKRHGIKAEIVETMRRNVIRNIPAIATLTDGDYDLAKEWYGCKGVKLRLDYCLSNAIRYMETNLKSNRVGDGHIRILLGNSATQTNRHMESLKLIEKYKDEDILVFAPLSYGDAEYAEIVKNEGKKILGNKFVPMDEYISQEDYYSFLYTIDIGIFNNDRQQGTCNIEALLYYGRKVYIRSDTTMWVEWFDNLKFAIYDIESIHNKDFEGFISMDKNDSVDNIEKMRRNISPKKRAAEWEHAITMAL